MSDPLRATCFFDGGARGTPGPAGCAIVLTVETEPDDPIELTKFLGDRTNNDAEYEALLLGMRTALARGVVDVQFVSDSKLVVEQVLGEWKCNEPRLQILRAEAQEMATQFEKCEILHVGRDLNKRADLLVTRLLDEHTGRKRQ